MNKFNIKLLYFIGLVINLFMNDTTGMLFLLSVYIIFLKEDVDNGRK